ncbi:MAG: hypothetical protein ACOY4R_21500 [Pseudomonadota bacterium]
MTAPRFPLLVACLTLPLSGCWYSSSASGSRDGTADLRAIDAANAGMTSQQARALVSDRTWRTSESSAGQQVHYSTADGRDFAWLPGEDRVLAGEWRVESGPDAQGRAVTRFCLRYPAEAVHPISKAAGGDWYCRPAGSAFHWVRERVKGDPLGLASRTAAPFVLRFNSQTIGQLQARIGR